MLLLLSHWPDKKLGSRDERLIEQQRMLPKNSARPLKVAAASTSFLMRAFVTIGLAAVLFFPACANQGTIVRKQLQPFPFPFSLDMQAIYRFELRDRAGQIRHQMVTAAVFAYYEVGDDFNDRQLPPPIRRSAAPEPQFGPMVPWTPLPDRGILYRN
jgi:hypothetical protein